MKGMQAAVLGGSAMILLVLALRLLLKKHLPRRLFPALWCAAAVRLLPTSLRLWIISVIFQLRLRMIHTTIFTMRLDITTA